MKINICPICVAVSSIWLVLSAGIALGYLAAPTFIVPTALLMGGTVVGMAYLGEKKFRWAAKYPQKWKLIIILIGMLTAYFFITHLTKIVVAAELIILLFIAYFLFIKQSRHNNVAGGSNKISEIKEQMEQCC